MPIQVAYIYNASNSKVTFEVLSPKRRVCMRQNEGPSAREPFPELSPCIAFVPTEYLFYGIRVL